MDKAYPWRYVLNGTTAPHISNNHVLLDLPLENTSHRWNPYDLPRVDYIFYISDEYILLAPSLLDSPFLDIVDRYQFRHLLPHLYYIIYIYLLNMKELQIFRQVLIIFSYTIKCFTKKTKVKCFYKKYL